MVFHVKCWKKHYIRIYKLKDTTLCEVFAVLFGTLHTYCKELITELSQETTIMLGSRKTCPYERIYGELSSLFISDMLKDTSC